MEEENSSSGIEKQMEQMAVDEQKTDDVMTEASGTENKRIAVIAMDDSKDSDIALATYVKNIYQEGDEVIVMYCIHHKAQHDYGSKWMPVDPNIVVHKYHEESSKAKTVCDKLKNKLDFCKIGGKVILVEGHDPGHAIVKKVHEMGAHMIVVGSRGHGTLHRKLLGSVSEYIMHHSHVPVVVCRHH